MTARELVRRLEQGGWQSIRQTGSHRHFKHPDHPGVVTIPMHAGDLSKGLVLAILKQTGLR